MNSETVYLKLIEKCNKNFTNATNSLDRGRAVYLFNEEQNKFIETSLQKGDSFSLSDIQVLITTKDLQKSPYSSDVVVYKMPEDIFLFNNIKVKATKGGCSDKDILAFQVRQENVHELLFDENNKPSFEYRETFYVIEGGAIKIYKGDFDISSVTINYVRNPVQFDIEGYVKEDGSESKSVSPELPDKAVDRIISMCATSFDINNENLQKVQFDINRATSKI